MPASLILACIWAVIATIIALLPRRFHWPGAIGLIATGLPLIAYVTWENGALAGLIALAAAASILRWPVMFLGRAIWRLLGGG